MSSYRQVHVLCPFFVADDGGHRITCEGCIKGSNIVQVFPRKADYEAYMRDKCQKIVPDCLVYKAMMSKYR